MVFSVSTMTQNLARGLKTSTPHFGQIGGHALEVQANLADQFFGEHPTRLTFTRLSENFTEIEQFDLSRIAMAPREYQGAELLGEIAAKIGEALVRDMPGVQADDPAIRCVALEIASQIGMTEFHELNAAMVQHAGIEVEGEPEHAIDVLVGTDGTVCVRRTAQWQHASADEQALGPLRSEWELTCALSGSRADGYGLSGALTQLKLSVRDEANDHGSASVFLTPEVAPSRFAHFVQQFFDGIESIARLLGFSIAQRQIDVVTIEQSSGEETALHHDSPSTWRGWKATKSVMDPQLTLQEINKNQVSIKPAGRLASSLDAFVMWFDESDETKRATYKENKFRFEYSAADLSVDQKLIEEDTFALSVLQSSATQSAVRDISYKLAAFLETGVVPEYKSSLFENLNTSLRAMVGEYPVPTLEIKDFDALLNTLRHHKDPVVLLALIWPIFKGPVLGSNMDLVDYLYFCQINETKDYIEHPEQKIAPDAPRFGNSRHIESTLFSAEKFVPYARDVDYRTKNAASTNRILARMDRNAIPYIAGVSGMANLTCKVLSQLGIHPHSVEGKKFCEAMSAFIVGSGMHSYYEVHKAFNIYAKALGSPPPVLETHVIAG